MFKYLPLLLIIFVSCTQKKKYKVVNDFPSIVELKGQQVFKKEFKVASLGIVDSSIIISLNRDTLLSVYDKEGHHLGRFGTKGRAPGEFLRFFMLRDITLQDRKYVAVVYDQINKEIRLINLSASLRNRNVRVIKNFELPDSLKRTFVTTDLFLAGHNKYIGMYDDRVFKQLTKNRAGFLLDKATNRFKTFPLLNLNLQPADATTEYARDALNLNTRVARITPDKEKVVFAMMHAPFVEIIDTKTLATKKFLVGASSLQTDFKLNDFKKGVVPQFFTGISVTNKSIYLLSSTDHSGLCKSCQEILKIGWNGKPQARYTFSNAYKLDWLAIDTTDKAFYGISWSKDKIYKFAY